MAFRISYGGQDSRALAASYTLSHGITPSVLAVDIVTPTSGVPVTGDAVLSDGNVALSFRDCRLLNVPISRGGSGTTWRLALADHRWRWQYPYISGEYNYVEPVERTPANDKKSARDLAELLLDTMGEKTYDVSKLSTKDYPHVSWDFANCAEELARLCDRYGCLLAFHPGTKKVTVVVKGEGADLPSLPAESLDSTIDPPETPESLLAVCEYTEFETDLELEAVGLDTDGAVKPLASLSYKPASWGADYLFFKDIADEDARKCALQSVFKWYRVKGNQNVVKWKNAVPYAELVPLLNALVQVVQEGRSDGTTEWVRKDSYVHGVFDAETTAPTNTAAGTKYGDSFSVDEKTGLVKFNLPVFQWSGGIPAAAALYLRCTVFGDRYTKARKLSGIYGEKLVPCEGIALQFVNATTVGPVAASDNRATVDAKLDGILTAYEQRYVSTKAGSGTYIGLWDVPLDGKRQQVSWSVSESGATTQVSVNDEHDFDVPSAALRREREKSRPGVTADMAAATPQDRAVGKAPAAQAREPRWVNINNGSGGTLAARSLVRVTSMDANGVFTVALPNADSMGGLLVTGPVAIANGAKGLASADWPLPVAYAGGAPSVGDSRGSANGSAQLTASQTGFKVVGVTGSLAVVVPEGALTDPFGRYTSTPEYVATAGAAGSSTKFSPGNHVHPIALTGESSFLTSGHANAGKVYAVYAPDPV